MKLLPKMKVIMMANHQKRCVGCCHQSIRMKLLLVLTKLDTKIPGYGEYSKRRTKGLKMYLSGSNCLSILHFFALKTRQYY
jgi:hypothetical protein